MHPETEDSRSEPGTPPDRTLRRSRRDLSAACFVLVAAALLTLLDAAKPLTIDDPIYYALARQIAHHPLDPYGFTVHWYQSPQPAFDVLIAPALPYWLSIPVRLFDGSELACKLWLFPISLLLVGSLFTLFRRFARGLERPLVVFAVFSAAILPSYNLMLDVPVLALSLGALTLFARAVDRQSLILALAAGLLAGIATETKYTGLLCPLVLVLYAALHRRLFLGVLAAAVAFSVFGAFEAWMLRLYGDSYFHHHLGVAALTASERFALTLGLFSHLGGVGAPLLLLALAALGVSRRRIALAGALVLLGFVVLAAVSPRSDFLRVPSLHWRITVPVAICCAFGMAIFAALAPVSVRLARSHGGPDLAFLLLWLGLELLGYYAFSPFAAVRRVLGLFVVAIFLFGRLASRTCATSDRRELLSSLAACGAAFGLLVHAVDLREADVVRQAVEKGRERVEATAPGATIWYVGHWGFQHYAEQAGLHAVVTGESTIRRGDWLLILDPRVSQLDQQHMRLQMDQLGLVDPPMELGDSIPVATQPSYYNGAAPLRPQRGPRGLLLFFRARTDFVAMP